jgi:hypothetical protein
MCSHTHGSHWLFSFHSNCRSGTGCKDLQNPAHQNRSVFNKDIAPATQTADSPSAPKLFHTARAKGTGDSRLTIHDFTGTTPRTELGRSLPIDCQEWCFTSACR